MLVLGIGAPLQAEPVNLELALLVDVSGSVSTAEFDLQQGGIASAFADPGIQTLITTDGGKIAVTLVYWSNGSSQLQAVGWTLIDSGASSDAFAAAVLAAGRPFSGATAPGSALDFITDASEGSTSFSENAFDGVRKIIDISGDGVQNSGIDTSDARDFALGTAGIDQINGIVIGGSATVLSFYTTEIIGGVDAFVLESSTFADFETAFRTKLERELTGEVIPEPSSFALLITGAIGLISYGWRRKRKQAA